MTQLTIIGCYLGLLLLLGIFSSRLFKGTSKDYMLASNSIGPFLLLMSIFGTTMTAFALVGSTGESFKEGVGVYGLLASSSGIIHSLCFFVLGIKLWSLGQKYGYTTQIQYFRDRFGSDKIGLLLFPILVGLVIPYLLIGVMASGAVINTMTSRVAVPVPSEVAGEAPTLVVKVPGAFKEGTFPEFLEKKADKKGNVTFSAGSNGGLPKELASLIICVVVLVYVFYGGMRGTAWANTFQTIVFMILGMITFYIIAMKLGGQDTLLASLKSASEAIPKHKLIRGAVGEGHEGISKLKFFTYLFVPLSVGMFPHLFQHWLTAKNANSFKLPVIAHPIFIMIVWVPCVLIGAWAASPLFLDNLPPPLQAKLLANPNIVLPVMVNKLATPLLGGFLTAGILAAIMSSLDSQFLCIGTMFTEDIFKHYSKKDSIDDRKTLLIARSFIILVVLVTYTLSLFEPRAVFTLGVWCFSGFSSLFPLVFASLYWKKTTKAGAYACVLAAFGSWLYLFAQSDYAAIREFTVKLPGTDYETMPVATMILCSTVALVVVSLLTKPPEEARLKRFFD
ncbi:MAG: sodium:solute symporter family protein [Fuerstiella sp.]